MIAHLQGAAPTGGEHNLPGWWSSSPSGRQLWPSWRVLAPYLIAVKCWLQSLLGIGTFLNLPHVLITETKNREATVELQVGGPADRRRLLLPWVETVLRDASSDGNPIPAWDFVLGGEVGCERRFREEYHVPITLQRGLESNSGGKGHEFFFNM